MRKEGTWFTPNSYDKDFRPVPDSPGVYVIIAYVSRGMIYKKVGIVYVGSAINLRVRYEKHEVLRHCKVIYDYVQFHFREEINFREVEKKMIQLIRPKFNIQYNHA